MEGNVDVDVDVDVDFDVEAAAANKCGIIFQRAIQCCGKGKSSTAVKRTDIQAPPFKSCH